MNRNQTRSSQTRSRRGRSAQSGASSHSRGVVVFGVFGSVALLVAFVLGVRFGQDRGDLATTVQEPKLSRLDRQAQELRQRRDQARARLSFHTTLSGPAKAAPVQAKPQQAKPHQAKPAPKAVVKSATEHLAQAKPTADAVVEQKKIAPADVVNPALSAAAVKVLGGDPEARVKLASAQPGQDFQADAQADAQADVIDSEGLDDSDEARHFSLQVGAFPDSVSAQSLVERLASKGYSVRIVAAEVAGRGTWYRVRVGDFGGREIAEQNRSQISEREGLFALVVPEG